MAQEKIVNITLLCTTLFALVEYKIIIYNIIFL
jgi:hypothetical protein